MPAHLSPKQAIIDQVIEQLATLGVKASANVDSAGHRLDLLATTPKGLSIAMAVRLWSPVNEALRERAKAEARLLHESSRTAAAWIIIPSLPDDQQTSDVHNFDGLVNEVKRLCEYAPEFSMQGTPPKNECAGKAARPPRMFVAMPFAARFDDTFYLGIVPAAHEAKLSCVRMDDGLPRQLVIAAIHTEIQEADYFLADLTDVNPNVVYEFGYAHALRKPVLLLSATPPESLPFDLRPWPMIVYAPGQVWKLKNQLSKALVHLTGEVSQASGASDEALARKGSDARKD